MPEEIRRRPPTTDTYSLPQTQEEFYFALPYDQHGSVPLRRTTTRSPPPRWRRWSASRRTQVERVYKDIEAKRRATRYLHDAPAARRRTMRRQGLAMCGIAGIVALRRRARASERRAAPARWRARSGTAALTSSGVYRDARAGLAHARLSIIDLATGQQPLANEDEHAVGRLQRRDLQLRRAARGARGARPPVSHRRATPRSSSTPTRRGATTRSSASTASGRSRSGTRTREQLVLARDRLGVRPLYCCEHDGPALLRQRGEGDLRGRRVDSARVRPDRASTQTFTFWTSFAPRTRVSRAIRSSARATCARTTSGAVDERAYWRGRAIPSETSTARSRGSLDEAADAVRDALERGDAAAHAARRRAGGQLPLGRARQLARRGARAGRAKGARVLDLLAPLRGRRVRRDRVSSARWCAHLGSEHREVVVSRRDIADVFPEVVAHTERPLLRTAPAPLFLLSRLVRETRASRWC